jgi:hypothetical protein
MPALGTDLVDYREQMVAHLWNNADNNRQFIAQHTTESEGGNTSVVGFLERTQNGSYQTMIDFDGEEVRMAPDNRQAWAAMNEGNRRGLHVCAMGRADWSRERWLQEGKLLERTAMRYAEWSRLYDIPLVKIGPDEIARGERGICGHIDITNAFHESDHWDPGYNFPFEVVIARAKEILGGAAAGQPAGEDDMATANDVLVQTMGPGNNGWPQLRPFPNNQNEVYSVFWNRLLGKDEGQTMVQALATLVFEATLRIAPYQADKLTALGPETVLGHAAAAHGGVLDLIAKVDELAKKVDSLIKEK